MDQTLPVPSFPALQEPPQDRCEWPLEETVSLCGPQVPLVLLREIYAVLFNGPSLVF